MIAADRIDALKRRADSLLQRSDAADPDELKSLMARGYEEKHARQILAGSKRYNTRQIQMFGDPDKGGGAYPNKTTAELKRLRYNISDRAEERKIEAEISAREAFYKKHMGRADSAMIGALARRADSLLQRADARGVIHTFESRLREANKKGVQHSGRSAETIKAEREALEAEGRRRAAPNGKFPADVIRKIDKLIRERDTNAQVERSKQ